MVSWENWLPAKHSEYSSQGIATLSELPKPLIRRLNPDRIVAEKLAAGVEYHEWLGSTNDRAKELARWESVRLPLLIVADRQSAGRGRGAKSWWTGDGSLAFSLLVGIEHWGPDRGQLPITGLAAGVALVEVLAPRLAPRKVGLHWPNDVCVEERKIAGILVEATEGNRLVVGIGVNTNSRMSDVPPELQDRTATVFDLTAKCLDHTELLVDWLRRWGHWFRCLPQQGGLVARAADRLCLQHGRSLRLRQGDAVHEGTCRGISADGALLLETAEGLRNYYSGTLHS